MGEYLVDLNQIKTKMNELCEEMTAGCSLAILFAECRCQMCTLHAINLIVARGRFSFVIIGSSLEWAVITGDITADHLMSRLRASEETRWPRLPSSASAAQPQPLVTVQVPGPRVSSLSSRWCWVTLMTNERPTQRLADQSEAGIVSTGEAACCIDPCQAQARGQR